MTRVTKDPEERKKEIMMAAFQLFATKGFQETAVSDIVKKVGVAQGLFYYYFKSKEEVLEAVMENAGELKQKVDYKDIVNTEFAKKAMKQ